MVAIRVVEKDDDVRVRVAREVVVLRAKFDLLVDFLEHLDEALTDLERELAKDE